MARQWGTRALRLGGALCALLSSPVFAQPSEKSAPLRQPRVEAGSWVEGRVVATSRRGAIIDLGRVNSLRDGARVEFFEPLERSDIPLAEGRVVQLGETVALVRLDPDEAVSVGAIARAHPIKPLFDFSAPRARAANAWEFSVLSRIVTIGDGAGVLIDAAAGYRFEGPLRIQASLEPFGVATGREGSVRLGVAVLSASYDTLYFEYGAGLGGQTVNDPAPPEERGTALTFAQRLRLGADEGVKLDARASLALFHQEFSFSDARLALQLPLTRSGWGLLLRVGRGDSGYELAEVVLRAPLETSDARRLFFVGSAGAATLFERRSCEPFEDCEARSYTSPVVGIGLEYRP